MRVIWLSDNSYVVKRGDDQHPITDDQGNPPDAALTARCFLSATEDGGAIHATLDQAAVPITAQKIRAVFSGTNINTHVGLLLTAAEASGQPLDIYDRVIVAGSYSDYERVRVERTRPAGTP